MNAGELRHRVTLQKQVDVQNDAGQFLPEWTDVADLWAKVEPTGGREYENDRALASETTHQVTLRWVASITITPKMRFLHYHNGQHRYLEIESVFNRDERDRETVCLCRESLGAA